MWPMQMMSATVNADLMRFYGEYAYGSISNIPRTTLLYNNWLTMEKKHCDEIGKYLQFCFLFPMFK